MVDIQSKHVVRVLKEVMAQDGNYAEVKKKAHEKDFRRVQKNSRFTIFTVGNCATSNSYYFDRHGDSPTIRPSMGFVHWLSSRLFKVRKAYQVEKR
jgi:hypothetical protein